MARSIAEIKKVTTDKYISYEPIQQAYGLTPGKTFEEQFSKVSIESILFYCFAFGVWVLEVLFGTHKDECDQLIDLKKPHRPRWYEDKALAFQYGRALIEEVDGYDNTGLTDEEIAAERVVKYAAVDEKDGLLLMKVAGEQGGIRQPLTDAQAIALDTYFNHKKFGVKDAGVRLVVINRQADAYRAEIDIYYNPMVLDGNGYRLDGTGNTTVQDAVKNYIENLPFNGEYSNMGLVDVLQQIDGVVIPELKASSSKYGQNPFVGINAKVTPDSGYLRVYNESDLKINWIPYQITE